MRKFDRWARISTGAALAAACLTALPSSSVADDQVEGRYPGLPFIPCEDQQNNPCTAPDFTDKTGWLNFPQIGLAGSIPAKQWTKIPLTMIAAAIEFGYDYPGPEDNDFTYHVRTFFTSPKGSPDNYGDSALIPVRTVAFGSIPVELTLQVSQKRDIKGLPFPLVFRPHDHKEGFPRPGIQGVKTIEPATLADVVNVRVRSLKVDGVDLELGNRCGTGPTAALNVVTKKLVVEEEEGYESPSGLGKLEEEFDPTIYQFGIQGGTLSGTLNIPSFSNCLTASGDDVSPILTSAISGNGNPLRIQVGATNCNNYDTDADGNFVALPNRPGVNSPSDPLSGCVASSHPNPKIVTVPEPIDIPDYAPGDQPTD